MVRQEVVMVRKTKQAEQPEVGVARRRAQGDGGGGGAGAIVTCAQVVVRG